ncbi:MAG: Hpt sensor hybrid histidine kinase [Chthonomonadales bacterium]|nr:Hpt sensor hybrid histidine kinase [Chthonomonadales bacterium]
MTDTPEGKSASASPPRPKPSSDGARTALAGKRIVIVEDEGITQMQLRRSLTRSGLVVVGTASTAESGIEVVLRERPDLVLMDIRMPGEFDGLEGARRILAQYQVCIVMLTAYAVEEYRERAREIGACGYLLKPVIAETLLDLLEQAYNGFDV